MKQDDDRRTGSWESRVTFSPSAPGVAYRPGEVLVRAVDAERAARVLGREPSTTSGSFVRFEVEGDVLAAVQDLHVEGVEAQPNHVLLPHCCCCGPHPAAGWGANPFQANPFQANPFQANPFQANPFQANPFQANPFQANPFQANPFQANPFQANPFQANHDPAVQQHRATGRRAHSATPAAAPDLPVHPGTGQGRGRPRIVVVDTGLAAGERRPHALHALAEDPAQAEHPDEDGDGSLDPVAGHGTFIAGIIERCVPGCELSVNGLLGGYGDADELAVADTLESLVDAQTGAGPDLVNLSFGGYALAQMDRLAQAVRRLQAAGTVVVASAGNDATCRPSYPAALPGVVSVGALGPFGAAPFTNHGAWVRACAPGVDVVSTFFRDWQAQAPDASYDEWACWSGTSFAAPAVLAALARCMREGMTGAQAVACVIDSPVLLRLPSLGTVVNSAPCWTTSP